MLARALYRGRQFFGALRPRVDERARDEAHVLLSERERALFESMTARDQQHCLDVYGRLRELGQTDRDLLVAALLHDAGKGSISVWHRVTYVVLDNTSPGLLRRLAGSRDGAGWRGGLYRCVHHPELGARLAREAGSSDDTVALIAGDRRFRDDPRFIALETADDAS
jgi:hypothetical protein